MGVVRAHINPGVFSWARDSAGYSVEETAKKIGCNPKAVARWESGDGYPTLAQAKKAAHAFGRPVALFYLKQPPEEKTLPDFRVFPDTEDTPQSPNLRRLIRQVIHRCEWAADFRRAQGDSPMDFIGVANINQAPRETALAIRQKLNAPIRAKEGGKNAGQLLQQWVARFEDIGVFVYKTDSHHSRAIDIKEMRGLAEANVMAPAIALNARDPSKRGQIFTLIHEAAHLWLGRSGVSNLDNTYNRSAHGEKTKIEAYCNRVASEFLIPSERFYQMWEETRAERDLHARIEKCTRAFSASRDAIARKAADARFIQWEQYLSLHAKYVKDWQQAKDRQNQKDEPPRIPTYKRLISQNGRPFVRLVLDAYYSGEIHPFKATALLGANAYRHVDRLAEAVF